MNTEGVTLAFRQRIFDYSEFSVNNVYFFGNGKKIESDIISVTKTGYLVEYEVKISRADFLADRRKSKWKHYKFNYDKAPKHFYYLLPKGTAKIEELPEFAGLIEFTENEGNYSFETVHKPKILNRLKATEKQKYKLLKKLYYKSVDAQYKPEYHQKAS